mgnify:CR=1 FL=1
MIIKIKIKEKNMKNIETNKKQIDKYTIILTLIMLIGIVTRIIGLGKIPIGINVDEAGTMYDAYTIANYGTDRFGSTYPVYMINYGGGQSALYTYLAAVFIKLFRFNLTVVRLPALLFSILYLIFGFLITKNLKNKKMALLVEFLIVICPWHFMQSRWALDCNLLSSMLLMSIYILTKAVESKSKKKYFLAGIFFGITLYTYALSYIIIPILLLILLGYMLYAKKIKISDIIVLGISLGLLAIPLILSLLVNYGVIEEIRLLFMSILKMWVFRNGEINLSNILHNVVVLIKSMFAFDINDYNAFTIFGTLYYISIPFTIFGFIDSIKNVKKDFKEKNISLDIVMLANFLSVCICNILVEAGINRINAIYISLIYYTALGIMYVSENREKIFKFIIIVYIIIYIAFLTYYFGIYGKENTNLSFNNDAVGVVKYIEKNEKFDGKKINFRLYAIQPYIYTLIGNEMPPQEFMNTAVIQRGVVLAYGRYVFYDNKINDDTIYVIQNDENTKNILKKNGFKVEEYNKNIDILYK